jgi:hypothetical protein
MQPTGSALQPSSRAQGSSRSGSETGDIALLLLLVVVYAYHVIALVFGNIHCCFVLLGEWEEGNKEDDWEGSRFAGVVEAQRQGMVVHHWEGARGL